MDNSETVKQDRACGEPSEELDTTVHVDHPTCQILDIDSIYECNPSSTNILDVDPSTKEEIMATGYPSTENIFVGHGFVGSFHPKYGVANWVFECLTLNQINVVEFLKDKKDYPRGEFYTDRKIDFESIVTSMDYKNSGYARGHLAAAANHKYNSLAYYSTFWYGNTAPMHKQVNSIFNDIERYGRNLAKECTKSYIITGPVFSKRDTKFMKDGCLVRVPDAYFKVFIFEAKRRGDDIYKVIAFMIANEPDNSENENIAKDIMNARVTSASIKELTGLDFLSGRQVDEYLNGRLIYEEPLPKEKISRRISEVPLRNERNSRPIFEIPLPNLRTHRGIGL